MEIILDHEVSKQPPPHYQQVLFFCLSRLFERAAYYGTRALLVLYMTSDALQLPPSEAYAIYSWLAILLLGSSVLGAVLGDLVIGNRSTILIGGGLQTIGIVLFCVPSMVGLYAGLALMVLGSGFFSPNIMANFGKSHLQKIKLLDAGFSWFYLAINIGAFFGVLFINLARERYGWQSGFLISAVLMALSMVPIFFTQEFSTKEQALSKSSPAMIATAFVLTGVFWMVYELMSTHLFALQSSLSEVSDLGQNANSSLNSTLTIVFTGLAAVAWTFLYSRQLVKLALGFFFGAVAYGTFLLLPFVSTNEQSTLFLITVLFLSLAEVHITPIIDAILTQYANPKYLAILMSLSFIPIRLFTYGIFLFEFEEHSDAATIFSVGILLLISLVVGAVAWRKKSSVKTLG